MIRCVHSDPMVWELFQVTNELTVTDVYHAGSQMYRIPMTSCVLSDLDGAGGQLPDELTVPAVHTRKVRRTL
jgi:hypothetical protein